MKKALSFLRKTFLIIITLLAIVMVVFTVISTFFVQKEDKNIFGYKMFSVLSDSMSDTFRAGDVIICKKVDPETLKEGDIITFKSISSGSYGQIVTHKILERTTYEGQDAFITYGTSNSNSNEPSADDKPVVYSKIIGKYKFKLPSLGKLLVLLKTPLGYISFILVPFALLIFMHLFNMIRLYKQHRREVAEEFQNEQQALTEAKEQTAALMDEIRLLKEQFNKNTAINQENSDNENNNGNN